MNIQKLQELLKLAECLESTPCASTPNQTATPCASDQSITSSYIGKYCIIRARDAGVHAGTVVGVEGDMVRLANSRRLWSFTVKSGVALSGAAVHGLKAGKLDSQINDIVVKGWCEILPTSRDSQASIEAL